MMDYLTLVSQQPQDKAALITDTGIYTYGKLAEMAAAIRGSHKQQPQAVFIHADTIVQQLVQFLAYSGTASVPVIATEVSKNQQFDVQNIPQQACMGVMTSGSTGRSKLLWRSYHSWADFFPQQNKIFGIDESTVIFCQGSLAFTGNLNIYMGVLYAGGTIVATEKFRPKHWLDMLKRYAVNTIYLIPSKLLLLAKQIKMPEKGILHIIGGSQSLGRQEADKLKKAFPNTEITLYYGASELNYITYIKDSEMTEDRTNIGHPFPGVSVSVQNEEIFVDTPYGIEGITLPFSLKDRGHLASDGSLHFLGRVDDICNVNGLKISACKVEQVLTELNGVNEAAVIAVHRNDADSLLAFIASEISYTKQELLAALKNSLLEYEIPKQFVFMEDLPKNESGKIDRLKLAEKI